MSLPLRISALRAHLRLHWAAAPAAGLVLLGALITSGDPPFLRSVPAATGPAAANASPSNASRSNASRSNASPSGATRSGATRSGNRSADRGSIQPAAPPPASRATDPVRDPAVTAARASASPTVSTYMESGPTEECVDLLFVGDGYTSEELETGGAFWKDVGNCTERLFEELPFRSYRSRFNVSALPLASAQTGCDPSPDDDRSDTALDSYFDHPRGRVLRVGDEARLTELVRAAGPVDLVLVMVNTERYGGSGSVLRRIIVRDKPLPAPVFSARHAFGLDVALHELGHSFANLTDAYADKRYYPQYPLPPPGRDLPHPNATLAGSFDHSSAGTLEASLKWGHFLGLPDAERHAWVHEGAYYRSERVFRPWPTCRMRDRQHPFCPVCSEAIARAITAACGQPWNDEGYHRAHPLALWAGEEPARAVEATYQK